MHFELRWAKVIRNKQQLETYLAEETEEINQKLENKGGGEQI